jgi:hypothetical protein
VSDVCFQLEIPIGPKWRNIELLRSAILSCLAAAFDDAEFSNVVGMITSELMENAVKYGDWTRAEQPYLKLRVRGNRGKAAIEVESPVAPGGESYALLQQTLAKLDGYATRREAYLARMREVAEQPLGSGISRMGLVRIAYEGPCHIEAHVSAGDTLTVTATLEQD